MVDKELEKRKAIKEESLGLKTTGHPKNKDPLAHSDEEIFHQEVLGDSPAWKKKQRVRGLDRAAPEEAEPEYRVTHGGPVIEPKRGGRNQSKEQRNHNPGGMESWGTSTFFFFYT